MAARQVRQTGDKRLALASRGKGGRRPQVLVAAGGVIAPVAPPHPNRQNEGRQATRADPRTAWVTRRCMA